MQLPLIINQWKPYFHAELFLSAYSQAQNMNYKCILANVHLLKVYQSCAHYQQDCYSLGSPLYLILGHKG